MKIELFKPYRTASQFKAMITYTQPEDVEDEYPLIGYVEIEDKKIGMCWSKDGWAGESIAMDLIGVWE